MLSELRLQRLSCRLKSVLMLRDRWIDERVAEFVDECWGDAGVVNRKSILVQEPSAHHGQQFVGMAGARDREPIADRSVQESDRDSHLRIGAFAEIARKP